jgi:hypothetical protein
MYAKILNVNWHIKNKKELKMTKTNNLIALGFSGITMLIILCILIIKNSENMAYGIVVRIIGAIIVIIFSICFLFEEDD